MPVRAASFAKLRIRNDPSQPAISRRVYRSGNSRFFEFAHDLSAQHVLHLDDASADGCDSLDARVGFEEGRQLFDSSECRGRLAVLARPGETGELVKGVNCESAGKQAA